MNAAPWSFKVPVGSAGRGPVHRLSPNEAERAGIARLLDLAELRGLEAEVGLSPWFDGVEIRGEWRALAVQVCGVSLDPFEVSLSGRFQVRAAPEGSAHAPDPQAEITLDPEAEDPPDILEGGEVDLAAYVVEHLALEIDPFPRKPGVTFEPPAVQAEVSPFAVLKRLKDEGQA